jgi:hypothetical protein
MKRTNLVTDFEKSSKVDHFERARNKLQLCLKVGQKIYGYQISGGGAELI